MLKQLLVERGLKDAYSGGLSSYSLVIPIAFVMQRWRRRGERSHVGDAWCEFLALFGREFWPRETGVSLQRNELFLLPRPMTEGGGGGKSNLNADARGPAGGGTRHKPSRISFTTDLQNVRSGLWTVYVWCSSRGCSRPLYAR